MWPLTGETWSEQRTERGFKARGPEQCFLFSQVWKPVVIRHLYGSHGDWKPCRTNNKPDLHGPISLWSLHVKPFMKSLWTEAIMDREPVPEECRRLQWISSSLSSYACPCDNQPCPKTVHAAYWGIENWNCAQMRPNYSSWIKVSLTITGGGQGWWSTLQIIIMTEFCLEEHKLC